MGYCFFNVSDCIGVTFTAFFSLCVINCLLVNCDAESEIWF